jgi:hypothetical protein
MAFMFNGDTLFDQYIRSWNVQHILSEPENFSTGSNLSPPNKPNWGGAPTILNTNDNTARSIRLNVPSTRVMQAKPQNSRKQLNKKQFTLVADSDNSNITDYAKDTESGISYFTPPEVYIQFQYNNTIQEVREERFATSLTHLIHCM